MILPGLLVYGNSIRSLINHNKYSNNYDFYKAVYLVNKENIHRYGLSDIKGELMNCLHLYRYFIIHFTIQPVI